MKPAPQPQVELRDVAPGLWIWLLEHPHWKPGQGWEPIVASTCVESRGETLVLDPLAPPENAAEFWKRLDARPPTAVVVIKPDHVRDVDLFVRRYKARAFGPRLFFREDVPKTDLQWIEPGSQLPGGLVALYDGRGRNETPLWLPEQRTIVFADALTAPGGELRVWASTAHEERALPALRALLELPFERVIVSHGEPVHTRAAYERALELPSWTGLLLSVTNAVQIIRNGAHSRLLRSRSYTRDTYSRRWVDMARIGGAEPNQQGLLQGIFTRIIYSMAKREVGRVVMPVKIAAHHAKLLWGYGQMEQSLFASKLVDAGLKNLAQLRVATLVGCPF